MQTNAMAAGFDHPIAFLDACHERIRQHAQLLERLASRLVTRGADAEAREAAARVLRFFEVAGENHHRDEEIDLFIAVERAVPSAELNAARSLLHRLRRDHDRIAALWAALRPALAAIAAGSSGAVDPAAAREFAEVQARHIELEQARLLPLARRVLDGRIMSALGAAMARRRGHRAIA